MTLSIPPIVAPLFESLDLALKSTLSTGTAKVIAGLGALYGTLWVLQLTAKSLVWFWHGLSIAIQEVVFSTLRMATIVAVAFNAGWYISTIVPFVNEFPNWVSEILSHGDGSQANQVDGAIGQFLQIVEDFIALAKFNPFVSGFDVMLQSSIGLAFLVSGGIPFLSIVVATLITLKVATTVLLVLGPLFIAFLLYDQTRQWFWGWVSTLAGFMLTQVMFSVILAIELNYIRDSIFSVDSAETPVGWGRTISILLIFTAFTHLAMELPNYAASIMGGAASQSTGLKGVLGKAAGISAARKIGGLAAKGLGRLFNRNSIG